MRITSKFSKIDSRSPNALGFNLWRGYHKLTLDLNLWFWSWQVGLEFNPFRLFHLLFPKYAALNAAIEQKDIKPLLGYLDKTQYSAATIILNSDSASKKEILKKLI